MRNDFDIGLPLHSDKFLDMGSAKWLIFKQLRRGKRAIKR
jgi:hypothetical protein